MRLLLFSTLMCLVTLADSQSMNTLLEGQFDGAGVIEYSDIWGYAAPNGTEVAILGGREEIFFLDVTDPANIVVINEFEVYNIVSGTVNNSVWRDFKTYGDYAYACADQGSSGLMIFDLSYVPDSVVLVTQTNDFFNRSHNIYIDTQHGRLYTAGANTHTSGTKILDLTVDPENPTELASPTLTLGYIHDIHVVNHIGYCSHGSDQALSIYDFTTPGSPVWLKDIDGYPEPGYNHSAWVDASGTRLVFADETHGQSLKLVNPTLNDFQTTNFHLFKSQLLPNNANSIGHNPFILDDLAFIAYYHDGLQVFDISDSNNIVNVGYYDTYPNNTNYNGFEGAWGVYPFLPSGRILVSDISTGLYIITLTGGVLPLDFLDFIVAPAGRHALLQWKSSVPDEGDVFYVEHSRDGGVFKTLATLPAQRERLGYSYLHEQIGPGTHFYRIRAKLRDNSEKLTEIRSVQLSSERLLEAFPTATTGFVTINAFKAGSLALYDAMGRRVWSHTTGQADQVRTDLSRLSQGQYFLEFRTAGGQREALPVTRL
ncbi:MAG: choice-of-anchor B family protein [Saprospiraceae bacterium]|nr:choice-of-anchor B family protein [Saprospiraceae bacterium]